MPSTWYTLWIHIYFFWCILMGCSLQRKQSMGTRGGFLSCWFGKVSFLMNCLLFYGYFYLLDPPFCIIVTLLDYSRLLILTLYSLCTGIYLFIPTFNKIKFSTTQEDWSSREMFDSNNNAHLLCTTHFYNHFVNIDWFDLYKLPCKETDKRRVQTTRPSHITASWYLSSDSLIESTYHWQYWSCPRSMPFAYF